MSNITQLFITFLVLIVVCGTKKPQTTSILHKSWSSLRKSSEISSCTFAVVYGLNRWLNRCFRKKSQFSPILPQGLIHTHMFEILKNTMIAELIWLAGTATQTFAEWSMLLCHHCEPKYIWGPNLGKIPFIDWLKHSLTHSQMGRHDYRTCPAPFFNGSGGTNKPP